MFVPHLGYLHPATISPYFALSVYIATIIVLWPGAPKSLKNGASDALALLFGPICAVSVCGFLVNNVYHRELARRDRTTYLGRVLGDVVGHVFPPVLAFIYSSKRMPVSMAAFALTVLPLYALTVPHLCAVYVGMPKWVPEWLAPAVAMVAQLAKYGTN